MIKKLLKFILIFFLISISSNALASKTQQVLLLMLPSNYEYNFYARLWTFEEDAKGQWKTVLTNIPVTIGKNGATTSKVEGDNKTPIGTFDITGSFGFSSKAPNPKLPYRQIHKATVAVDDTDSQYYNQIIESNKVAKKDWNSAEQMFDISLYKYGLTVAYNPTAIQGLGSNVFIHIWRDPHSPTAGCIAMSESNLVQLIRWLKIEKHPVLVIRKSSGLTR